MTASVATIAAKWKASGATAAQAWNNGIQQYAGNPMAAAAAEVNKAVANYSAAAPRMAANLQATPVSFWKSQAAASQSNYSQGFTKGLPAYTAAIQKLSTSLWPGMKSASQAAGGGPQGAAAAIQYAIDQKNAGNT
jgi:hypothetical protein